jgi:YD repeat-containing protein
VQGYTEAFAERHMDEAWFILTPALINNPSFRNNFDMHGFSSAVADLTNGKIIVPVPDPVPTPPPVAPPVDPGPPTPPDPAWADFPFHEMDAWANHKPKTDEAYNRNAKDAYRRWKAEHRVDQRNASTRRMVYDEAGRPVGMVDLAGSFWASQS